MYQALTLPMGSSIAMWFYEGWLTAMHDQEESSVLDPAPPQRASERKEQADGEDFRR